MRVQRALFLPVLAASTLWLASTHVSALPSENRELLWNWGENAEALVTERVECKEARFAYVIRYRVRAVRVPGSDTYALEASDVQGVEFRGRRWPIGKTVDAVFWQPPLELAGDGSLLGLVDENRIREELDRYFRGKLEPRIVNQLVDLAYVRYEEWMGAALELPIAPGEQYSFSGASTALGMPAKHSTEISYSPVEREGTAQRLTVKSLRLSDVAFDALTFELVLEQMPWAEVVLPRRLGKDTVDSLHLEQSTYAYLDAVSMRPIQVSVASFVQSLHASRRPRSLTVRKAYTFEWQDKDAARLALPSVVETDRAGGISLAEPATDELGNRPLREKWVMLPQNPQRELEDPPTGTVRLKVVVSIRGRPRDVSIEASSGNALLDRAAVRTVRRWRYYPKLIDGKPVDSEVVVPISFGVR
jgi:TonB family protein